MYTSSCPYPLESQSWCAPPSTTTPPPTLPPLLPPTTPNAYYNHTHHQSEFSSKFFSDVGALQRLPYTPAPSTPPTGAQPGSVFFARSSNQMHSAINNNQQMHNHGALDLMQGAFHGASGNGRDRERKRGLQRRASTMALTGSAAHHNHGYRRSPPPLQTSSTFSLYQQQKSPTLKTQSPFHSPKSGHARTFVPAASTQPQRIAGYDVTRPIDLSSPPRHYVKPVPCDHHHTNAEGLPYPHDVSHDLCFPPSPAYQPQFSPVVDLLQPFAFDRDQFVNNQTTGAQPQTSTTANGHEVVARRNSSECHPHHHSNRRSSGPHTPPRIRAVSANTPIISPQPQRRFITTQNGSPMLGFSGLHLDGMSRCGTAAGVGDADERFWGYLVDHGKSPAVAMGLLKRFLRGVAGWLIDDVAPRHSIVISPAKMATFYMSLQIHSLPKETSNRANFFYAAQNKPQALAHLYKHLQIPHFLLPSSNSPPVPALTPEGFEKWTMLQILLDPGREAAVFNELLKTTDIKDPENGNVFPRTFPRSALPEDPDEEAERRCGGVFSPLRIEDWDKGEEGELEVLRERVRDLEAEVRMLRSQAMSQAMECSGSMPGSLASSTSSTTTIASSCSSFDREMMTYTPSSMALTKYRKNSECREFGAMPTLENIKVAEEMRRKQQEEEERWMERQCELKIKELIEKARVEADAKITDGRGKMEVVRRTSIKGGVGDF
ncbi:hypothetical protein RUND412_005135 [Rhizina undulata]